MKHYKHLVLVIVLLFLLALPTMAALAQTPTPVPAPDTITSTDIVTGSTSLFDDPLVLAVLGALAIAGVVAAVVIGFKKLVR